MGKRIMRSLTIKEISGVDRPAQKGAVACFMKRDDSAAKPVKLSEKAEAYIKREFTDDQRTAAAASGAAMPGGGYPIENRGDLKNAIEAFGRAKNPAKTKAHIISRARALDAMSVLPDAWKVSKLELLADLTNDQAVEAADLLVKSFIDELTEAGLENDLAVAKGREYANALVAEVDKSVCAMRDVFAEIEADPAITNKAEALQESVSQFTGHIVGIAPDLNKSAIFAAAIEAAGLEITEGGALTQRETAMGFDIKKSLGLPATATDADIEKAFAVRDAAVTTAANFLKMSSTHAAYMNNEKAKMPSGGKEAFAAMSADERTAHMGKNPIEKSAKEMADDEEAEKARKVKEAAKNAGDEVLKVDGREIRKSVVGEDTFAVMKSQQDRLAKQEDDAAVVVISKRATASMPLVGKADDLATLIHGIAKLDGGKELAETVAKKFEQMNEVLKSGGKVLFEEVGKGGSGGQFAKASDEVTTLAQKMMADSNGKLKSIFKAKDLVRQSNPELKKREEAEAADARKAA